MASTTVSGGAVSVSSPSVTPTTTGNSPVPFVDVMAMGSSSDPQSDDGDDQSRRDQQNSLDDDDMDDQRPRMSPTKRRLDDPDMDFSQTSKKRRKQYKPVRIAVPASSNVGELPGALPTVYAASAAGMMGPEDEGEEDGEFAGKFEEAREGLQARLSGGSLPMSSGNMEQDFEKPESSFEYKCFDCSDTFPSSEALAEHVELVHRQKTQQNIPVQMAPSNEAVNPPKRDAPLDLAQSQTPNPTSQSDFPVGSWPSGNPGGTPTTSSSDNLPVSIASPSQIPPIPFPMNPFSDGKNLIPNLLGLAPHFLFPHIPEKSPTAMASQSQSTGTSGNADNSSSTIRIFNPEAYCELCNKEFCNKYFLKTHKANKHGIYSDTHTITSGSSLSGASFSNSFTQPMPSLISSRSAGASASYITQKTQTELNNLPKSAASGQMKINCEVCHKKFSNRYVVLRHKAKVHGLVEDSLIGADLAGKIGVDFWPRLERDEHGNTSTSSETGSIPLENQTNEAATPGQMDMTGDTRPFSREKSNVSPQVTMNKSSPSMTFKLSPSNSFLEFNMDQEEPKQQFQQEFSGNHSASETTGSSTKPSMPPNTWAPYHVSPSTSTDKIPHLSQNHLRKMGVVNADAFCEICCKEYCNKYFLRTHKLKRHGIVTPEFEAKAGGNAPGRGAWNQVQTSPLNLIVGEQSGSNWNAVERNVVMQRPNTEESKKEEVISNGTSGTQTDVSDGEKLECNVCGRHFQSHYLMQMHKAYMHPPPSGEGYNEEISFSESASAKPHTSSCNSNGSTNREDQSPSNNQGPSMTSENSSPSESNNANQSDYASGNLQKIQTMIMQLNKFNEGKINCCTICNKEVEDKYILRSHMVSEHGVVIEDDKDLRDENSSESTGQQSYSSAYCSICKKDFFAKCFLKKHITEFHGNMLPKLIKEELKDTPERGSNSSVEKRVSVTPTSSYCEICNKELCNKYFMKTHMQRMHGIEIENGSQIGGVICDICNKELCSKYFVRVHKQNTHGIVEDTGILQQGKDNSSHSQGTPPGAGMAATLQDSNDPSLKPSDAGDLTHRYFTHFTEVCPICNRRFRSTKWLKAHLMNDHSEMGIEKWKEIEMQYQFQLQQTRQAMAKSQSSMNYMGKANQSHENGGTNTPTQSWKTNIGTQSELSMAYSEAGGSSGIRRYSNEMDVSSENILQTSGNYECDQNKSLQKPESNPGEGENEGDKQKLSHSNLFNSGESTTPKNYHCSFCPFRTPVLAYLFVHEKTHAGLSPPPMPGTKKQMECPICHINFVHSDLFHHHLVSHQYSGMIGSITTGVPMQQNFNQSPESYRNSPGSQQKQNDNSQDDDFQTLREPIVEVVIDETGDVLDSEDSGTYKYKCLKCTKRFKTQELLSIHAHNKGGCLRKETTTSPPNQESTSLPYSPGNNETSNSCSMFSSPSAKSMPADGEKYKCMQCPFATQQISILKKHIMKEHPEEMVGADPTCPAAMELRRRLEEAARQSQVPASYAVPQRVRLREEGLGRSSFIMQPFLLEEPEEGGRSPGSGSHFQSHSINGKFVPSLVFLPVREKLSKPLTVSFSLTPA
ncbi:uncharacterized protein LOC124171217 [Ischnura elegans]|uniref:uncharacterized protein LOC124171217 n=1 Tax=Ischnura elegans TaxID=197161 RepID=UPI001ED8A688|nr:uncharacterized protein LOC124171217 [Ischnura elegans]